MDDDIISIRARIRGRVQGVGYRDWAIRRADALRLRGWVRNRRDGSVEALFIGPRPAVERMIADCRLGPSLAHVEAVDTEAVVPAAYDTFNVRPTE